MNEKREVLVVDEFEYGMQFTKFPGGGLELGEGLIDGLIREWQEELGQLITVTAHFYTTDFFQQSGFHLNQQLISVYYKVKPVDDFKTKISDQPFDFADRNAKEVLSFRWLKVNEQMIEQLTFPIDKVVAEKLVSTSNE